MAARTGADAMIDRICASAPHGSWGKDDGVGLIFAAARGARAAKFASATPTTGAALCGLPMSLSVKCMIWLQPERLAFENKANG